MKTKLKFGSCSLFGKALIPSLTVAVLLLFSGSLRADATSDEASLVAEIDGIISDVEMLEEIGALDRGGAISLIATLETTRNLVVQGAPSEALAGTLVASLNQVSALIDSGRLDDGLGEVLFFEIVDVLRTVNES